MVRFPLVILCTFFVEVFPQTAADQIGKDLAFISQSRSSGMAKTEIASTASSKSTSEVTWLALGLFRVYQKLVSSQDRSVCIFTVSCSQFALKAVGEYGIFHGLLMASDRVQRCNGLSRNYYTQDPKTGLAKDEAMEYFYLGKKGRD